jgi:hypothetical protein
VANKGTDQKGDEHQEQKSEICSIENEQGSHTSTEATALPPSFDGKKFRSLAHSLYSKKCIWKLGEVATNPNPLGSYL